MSKLLRTSAIVLFAANALAQQTALTLADAVQQATDRYPAIRSALAQVSASAAAVDVARTRYLPRADFVGQVNRATHNNVFGMLLPQSVISPISGPVLGTNSLSSVWGSAVGVLASWEPFDFGLRRAEVAVAETGRERARAEVTVTRLEVASAAADAFLAIIAAQQAVAAAQAAVHRAELLRDAVAALVKNELRPGADYSRAEADTAVARNQLIQAEQAVAIARATLAQLTGTDAAIAVDPGGLLQLPAEQQLAVFEPARHPLALAQLATVAEVRSRERALERSYFPRFSLQGTTYARGTGIEANGTAPGGANGLGPNIQNWGIGMTVYFPALDFASIHARRTTEYFNERRESARYEQVLQDVGGQMAKARASLEAARRIARNTPIELQAARSGQQQAAARYKSGLGTIAEIADAERILTQAEVDEALARLGIWRALLGVAVAQGDLSPFLDQLR